MTAAPVPDPIGQPSGAEAASRVARLFERHGRMVYGVCRAMLRDTHEAEDATQQAFLSAHRSLLGRVWVRDEGAWLATIARNECRGRIAAGTRMPLPISDDELAAIPTPADEAERRVQADALRNAIADLPERQREAVVLRDLYGLGYAEVATALGISRPATEALLFRARRALRRRLRPLVTTVLTVPLSVQEGLAQAIPGFGTSGSGAVVAGAAGGGVLVKLTAGPVAAKFATAAVAVATVGTVGTVGSERAGRDGDNHQANVTTVASQRGENEDLSGLGSGSRHESDDHSSGTNGPGSSDESDDGDNSGPGEGRNEDNSGSGSGDSGETEQGDGGSDERGGGGGSSGRQGASSGEGDGPSSNGSGGGGSGEDEPESSDG
jgi:RNA polymerase sigma factor (sigma-70 family)